MEDKPDNLQAARHGYFLDQEREPQRRSHVPRFSSFDSTLRLSPETEMNIMICHPCNPC